MTISVPDDTDQIPASHLTGGRVDRTRPLCPYPQVARYKGADSTDDAANLCAAVEKGTEKPVSFLFIFHRTPLFCRAGRNSSPARHVGSFGRFATFTPISIPRRAYCSIPEKSQSSRYSSDG